jgi:predicted RNA-binding protein with TRAM domain
MTARILQDPTASVRTRKAIASLSAKEALNIKRVRQATTTITMSLTSGVGVYTVTVPGAVVGDTVMVSPTTTPHSSAAAWSAFVSATNTVTIRVLISSGPGGTVAQGFQVVVIGF